MSTPTHTAPYTHTLSQTHTLHAHRRRVCAQLCSSSSVLLQFFAVCVSGGVCDFSLCAVNSRSPDQLLRAMVSITCSSLLLNLCLRACSSRSSAHRIYRERQCVRERKNKRKKERKHLKWNYNALRTIYPSTNRSICPVCLCFWSALTCLLKLKYNGGARACACAFTA